MKHFVEIKSTEQTKEEKEERRNQVAKFEKERKRISRSQNKSPKTQSEQDLEMTKKWYKENGEERTYTEILNDKSTPKAIKAELQRSVIAMKKFIQNRMFQAKKKRQSQMNK